MKASKKPIPLAVTLARKLWGKPRAPVQGTISPLPYPITLEFFVPGNPMAKSTPFPQWSEKLGRVVYVEDKAQKARATAVRTFLMQDIVERYPTVIPYLPMVVGSVSIFSHHLFPPAEDWYPGKEHLCVPDVSNLGKMIEDAPAGRTKNFASILYWDDCPVKDGWNRKDYWDPTVEDPDYPQQPGSIFLVTLAPPVRNPKHNFHCPQCGKGYVEERYYVAHKCPLD